MLDDLKIINQRDKSDALGVNGNQAEQLKHRFEVQGLPESTIDNVVLSGMGGSALAGLFTQRWLNLKVPYEVSRDYQLPAYVGPKSLVVISSYSGNTEETLAALSLAQDQEAMIAILTSGGKLLEIAESAGYPALVLPQVGQPRYAVMYGVKALVTLFAELGLIDRQLSIELEDQAEWLTQQIKNWQPEIPLATNQAKQIAHEIIGKSAVIYSGPELMPAAYKWKISLNENAKHVAWWNQFPEFNHNEFVGWSAQPQDKPYCVIDLRSSLYNPRVSKRFELSQKLLSGKRPDPVVIEAQGQTNLQQLLWTIALGDFVSLYVAILNNLDPTPVDLIERFKKEL